MATVLKIVYACWDVLGEMSLYLLLGFLIAGVLSVCLSRSWIERSLGGRGFMPILKASLFGVPLPLCSCSVLPVGASIRKNGASREATAAFLLSTPQTGVDSIAVTFAILGPVFAVFRPIAALVTGLLGGLLVRFSGTVEEYEDDKTFEVSCEKNCCCSKEKSYLYRIFHFAFIELPADLAGPLLFGIVLAALIAVYIPAGSLEAYVGAGVVSIIIMMVVGAPLYVCATASVPIAAGFMYAGASPGAALAFLIAGPATNIASLTTLLKILGKRATFLYLSTVFVSALLSGLILNAIAPLVEISIPQMGGHHHVGVSSFENISSIILLAVLFFALRSRRLS